MHRNVIWHVTRTQRLSVVAGRDSGCGSGQNVHGHDPHPRRVGEGGGTWVSWARKSDRRFGHIEEMWGEGVREGRRGGWGLLYRHDPQPENVQTGGLGESRGWGGGGGGGVLPAWA